MKDFLTQLAMESDVLEEVAGNPDEITVVTDSTETELEEVISDMADDVEKAAEQSDGAEKMVEIIDSLESKVTMLRSLRERGENLNAHAAAIYTKNVITSLESRSFPAGLYAKEMNELTHSFESTDAYDYSVEAEEKTTSLLGKTKAMLSKALDAFITFWKDLMARASGLGKNMIELGGKLVRVAEGMEGKEAKEATIKTAGLEIVAADPVAAVNKLLDASKAVAGHEAKLSDAMKSSFMNELKAADGAEVKGIKELVAGVADKIELPGGKHLEWSEKGNGTLEIKGEGTKAATETTAPLSKEQVKAVGEAMVKVGTEMKVSDSEQKALIAKLEAGITEATKLVGTSGDATSGKAMKNFNIVLTALRSGRSQLNKYAAVTAKQAYRLASMSASRHAAAKKDA